ncbi:MAG: DUF2911 domain-containing protein [Gemmatimonadota bacterium]|nr:DUF2911 domain-containing protein [Gemmatimonadota bacterium]MDH5758346.1 DUF2911 domain-containing protein [Gemmatimonadota bacterium]
MRRTFVHLSVIALAACGGNPDSGSDGEMTTAETTAQATAQPLTCGYTSAAAELAERPSPPDSVAFQVGDTHGLLCYGRPSAKGRVMVGDLDPFDTPWRMGANEPTTLHLSGAAMVGTVSLAAGSYAVYAIPTEGDWTIVVNSSLERWGIPIGEEVRAQDVGEFTVTPTPLDPPVETLTFSYESADAANGALVYQWEGRTFRIPVMVH